MKVIVLTRGDLADKSEDISDNLYSDVWLNGQESAEAIVPEGYTCREGLNVNWSFKLNDW